MWNRWIAAGVIALLMATVPACRESESESLSQLKAGGNRVGEYKGHVAINQIIQTRFLEPGVTSRSFAIGRYLDDYINESTSLSALLGRFSGEASTNEFRNGRPNSLNMLLWQIALSKLATEVALSCRDANAPQNLGLYPYNASFAARLKPLCSWPSPEAKQEAKLLDLWQAVMGFDAPKQEFDAWRDYFLAPTSPFANASRDDSLKAMIRSMLLSPYFLLEH